jgi:hypothetical protein
MGLVFPLQPDFKNSQTSQTLTIRTTKSRFSMGFGFLVGGALLSTMYLAASPIFSRFWNEGELFDKAITVFILGLMVAYPLAAIVSWFFEDVVVIQKSSSDGTLCISKFSRVLGWKFFKKDIQNIMPENLFVHNWRDSLNVAALTENKSGVKDRYATKGHWILSAKDTPLEKRAKKDEVLDLYLQICRFFNFKPSPKLIETQNSSAQ